LCCFVAEFEWQEDRKDRAFAKLGRDCHFAAMFANNCLRNAESKPGSLGGVFGCVVVIEDVRQNFGCNAAPCIDYVDPDTGSLDAAAYRYHTLLTGNCLRSVVDEIEKYLIQLRRIAFNFRYGAELLNYLDMAWHHATGYIDHVVQAFVQVEFRSFAGGQAGKVAQVLNQLLHLRNAVEGIVEHLKWHFYVEILFADCLNLRA